MSDEDLIHDGVCPVCGDEFGDGFEDVNEMVGESIEGVKMCVLEEGEAIYHLPWEVDEA